MELAAQSNTDYIIIEAVISSTRTTTEVDIRTLVSEFIIYEHIEKPYLTGKLTFKEEENILQEILSRLEKIESYLNTPGGPIIHHINKYRADILSSIRRHELTNYSQIEQYIKLTSILPDATDLPPLRGWAISPDVCIKLYRHVVSVKPEVVVEFGSGASTYIIALAIKENGRTKYVHI